MFMGLQMKGVLLHNTPQFLTEDDYFLSIKVNYKILYSNTLQVKILCNPA